MYGTLISTVTVGAGGASSIDFTSIPQTPYTDLVLVISSRINGSTADPIYIKFNGSMPYPTKRLRGDGPSVVSQSANNSQLFYASGTDTTSSTFGNGLVYIPNYAGSTYKSFSVDGVNENNGTTAYQFIAATVWQDTSAITSISVYPQTYSFVQYSTASLYGLTKGSGGATVS